MTAQELRKRFEVELKMLQDFCPHTEIEIMPFAWTTGYFKYCENCEKTWEIEN